MKNTPAKAALAAALLSALAACTPDAPPAEAHRPIRSVALQYGQASDVNRYFAAVQARHEVAHAFRVAGKVSERRVDVGQKVRAGDVLAVLDSVDYRLAQDAALRQREASEATHRLAESDWKRLKILKDDGSVSAADEERARRALDTARAAATAQARQAELAGNQTVYTVLRASRSGVVTSVAIEAGQVVAAGQPAISVADEGEAEIVVDVPENQLAGFRKSRFRAFLSSYPDEVFAVELREMAAQASSQTRTFRARLNPVRPLRLPLGASATLIAERVEDGAPSAAVPAAALTQLGGKPAVWTAQRVPGGKPVARVKLVPVVLHGYRNDEVLVSGPEEGTVVVTAGVQKMSPGLLVALPGAPAAATVGAGSR